MFEQRLSRRSFLKLGAVSLGASVVTAGYGYGRYGEPNWVKVDEIQLAVPGLPPHLAGLRFAQLSDIHAGAFFSLDQFSSAIRRVNDLAVAWLMITGDFVTTPRQAETARKLDRAVAARSLVEPLQLAAMPVFASVGNHDIWGGLEPIEESLAAANVTLLRNAGQEIVPGVWLAGVDDAWTGKPDLRAALADRPPGAVSLLMSHAPDYFDTVLAAEAPVAAQFSGHSHGGQVRLPTLLPGRDGRFSFAPKLPPFSQHYPIGLQSSAGRHVYTNRGLGCWPLPIVSTARRKLPCLNWRRVVYNVVYILSTLSEEETEHGTHGAQADLHPNSAVHIAKATRQVARCE